MHNLLFKLHQSEKSVGKQSKKYFSTKVKKAWSPKKYNNSFKNLFVFYHAVDLLACLGHAVKHLKLEEGSLYDRASDKSHLCSPASL